MVWGSVHVPDGAMCSKCFANDDEQVFLKER